MQPIFVLCSLVALQADSQVLTLKNAVTTAIDNYGTIKAKADYLKASQASGKGKFITVLTRFQPGGRKCVW